MLNINEIENHGYFYPGMSGQVVSVIETELRHPNPAFVKGDEALLINDDLYADYALWVEDKDIIEIQPIRRDGGITRIPKSVFEKYFQPFDPEIGP